MNIKMVDDMEMNLVHKQRLFLSDPIIKAYNSRLETMYSLMLPRFQLMPNGSLVAKYAPDDAFEISKILRLREAYIQSIYPELVISNDK